MEDIIEVEEENLEDTIEVEEENVYFIPSGEIEITSNGKHDVSSYKTANVNVVPSGTININENGIYDVTDYSEAVVETAGYSINDFYTTEVPQDASYFGINSLLKIQPPTIVAEDVDNLTNCFRECRFLKKLDLKLDNQNRVNINSLFYNCTNLEEISISSEEECRVYTASIISSISTVFSGCNDLKTLVLDNITLNENSYLGDITIFGSCDDLENLSVGSFLSTLPTSSAISLNFTNNTKLTHDSLLNIINGLNNNPRGTLKLGSENLDKLSDEEKQMITNKGWSYE